ncbi:amino acid adenylation domain-containing protein [Paenibacillus kyungheensis]|uniref:Amino acid adenylation domain-containing protein n=1 Tax=Paenibacillus kyungheensis TaxID=1452732 RepID=A0AAX3M9D3_9BACL|nr:non-ribosomal peptide synthetase [Paenibacillus kyungheensis]WCT58026.1 amino acid adenylation domain-containing protein [Paenibacillus kyungheensis]
MSDNFTNSVLAANDKTVKEKAYWQEKMQGDPVMSVFPSEHRIIDGGEGANSVSFQFNHAVSNQLKHISNGSDYGMFILFVAGMNLLLSQYTNSSDIVIAMPAFRQAHDVDNEDEARLLVLRTSLQNCNHFRDVLKATKQTVTKANVHQNYPFHLVMKHGGMLTDLDTDTQAQILVGFDRVHDLPQVKESRAEIIIILSSSEQTLEVQFSFNQSRFEPKTAQQWGTHLERLFEEALFHPEKSLSEIGVLKNNEIEILTNQFNNTQAEYDKEATLPHLFEEQTARTPDQTAAVFSTGSWTYSELNKRANQLARTLQAKGVKPDQLVGVLLERSPEMMMGLLAILKAGGAYVPIDPTYPKERISYVLQDSGASLLLTRGKETTLDVHFEGEVLDLTDEALYTNDDTDLSGGAGANDIAYVIYTSGSTGEPKGVMIEHQAVINRLQWMQKQFPLTTRDVILQKTPFSFDVSVWELFWWSLSGASVVFAEPGAEKDPEALAQSVHEHQVTVMHFVPSMLQLFLEHVEATGGDKLRSLRRVFVSGETLQASQASRFGRLLKDRWGTELINLYGPTEATVDVSYHECSCEDHVTHIPIGQPIDNMSLYILDREGRVQPVGVPGELYIGGVGLARGYWNRPELTEERFTTQKAVPGIRLYRTGDIGKWLSNGEMAYGGRIDHQVKIRGNRIELGEIETQLLRHPQIQEAVVTVHEAEAGRKELSAYYVSEGVLGIGAIQAYVGERLPAYMVPTYGRQLETMPLTANGKLDRKRLPAPQAQAEQRRYAAPRNEVEEQLASVWQEVLGIERIGIDEPYQEIGGDSIKTIRIIFLIKKRCQIDLQMLEFYQHPTIRDLADFLKNRDSNESDEKLAVAKEKLAQWQQELFQSDIEWLLPNKEIEEVLPLSDIQQGMIYHSLTHPQSSLYHEQFLYEFQDDSFSEQTFRQAMELLIDKHAIFRTTFNLKDLSVPVQLVHRQVSVDLELISLVDLVREKQENFLNSFLEQDRKQPFIQDAVSSNIIWRMRVFQLNEHHYCLAWLYHHAMMDGWSNASFITELWQIYFGLKQGLVELKPLRHSYRDMLIEQWSIQDDPEVHSYWRNELENYKRFESPFAVVEEELDESLDITTIILNEEINLLSLMQAAKINHVSLKTILFTAYACMMHMIDAENDFVVGVVVNNRPLVEDGEKILGCFLNSIPVRIRINGTTALQEFMLEMDKKLLEAQQYGKLSLARILQAVGEHDGGGNKLFDNIFNYVDLYVYDGVSREMRDHQTLDNVGNYERTNALFQFDCFMENEHLHIVVRHETSFYPKVDVECMISSYARILKAIIDGSETILNKTLFSDPNQIRLLRERAETYATPLPDEPTISGLIDAQAKRSAQRTALISQSERLTYAELNRRVDQLAWRLVRSGVKEGDIVALMARRSIEMMIGLLAILRAGGAYLPIDPDYPDERIQHMFTDSGTNVLLTHQPYNERVNFGGEILDLAEHIYEENDAIKRSFPHIRPNNLAYCIYTSGSTGLPKGVLIEHRSVVNLLEGMTQLISFQEDQTFLSVTTISFDIFVLETLLPLMKGMCVVIANAEEQIDPAALGRLMLNHDVSMLQVTPSRLRLLLDNEIAIEGMAKLTNIMIGGESFGIELIHTFREHSSARVFNMYGPTETTVWSMVADLTEADEVTLGRPIANTEVLIVDRNGQLQPFGTVGELCIAGAGLARGYHGLPDMTQAKFVTHPIDSSQRIYKTGDLARWQMDGQIKYIGRRDHQVKIRGYRVELSEIEHVLGSYAGISSPLVVAQKRDTDESYLIAYYLSEKELPVALLREHLTDRLPDYMIPGAFVQLEYYPLLPNGKINRAALPEPNLSRNAMITPFRQAVTDIEQRLAQLWQEIVRIETIGMDDNFLEAGGNSISLVQFHAKLESFYPNQISIAEMFSYPTIGKLAAKLEQAIPKKKIEIDRLLLPKHFLNLSGSLTNENTFLFHLSNPAVDELAILAQSYNVETDDVLLAAGIYLFHEITEQQVISLQTMTTLKNEMITVSVDMQEISHFSQLFHSIYEQRTQAILTYKLEDFQLFAKRVRHGAIAPLFYRSSLETSHQRLSDWFGFMLGYSIKEGRVTFTCDYDGNMINEISMEQWAAGYIKLLGVLTNQFLKEAP